ncbi:MAG: response regulator [Candidatus Eremiobacteraeota bacterium]|nr:response regulator [Candidatus Eremiobacteraeota bacterium]
MPTILVVDDEAANRELLATVLGYAGHAVLAAAEGTEGLRLAREHHPELVILDLSMPGMDGVDFVQTLRAIPELTEATVALYTATTANAATRQFMKLAGIEHVIPKPAEPEELLRAVERALGRSASADVVPAAEAAAGSVVSRARHDLRNALAIVAANLEAMADGVLEPTPQRLGAVLDALREAQRLLDESRG